MVSSWLEVLGVDMREVRRGMTGWVGVVIVAFGGIGLGCDDVCGLEM